MKIRKAEISDARQVADLVRRLSVHFLEPGQGELPRWFMDSISVDSFVSRFGDDEFDNFLFEKEERVIGYIAVKKASHLFHLFVASSHQQQGVAKSLWEFCKTELPISHCTVRSSLFAVPIYTRLGFVPSSPSASKDGIGFQAMVYSGENH